MRPVWSAVPVNNQRVNVPPISVVICTCNRGALIATSVESILRNNYPVFELVVVDQSDDTQTQKVIGRIADQRLRYIRSDTRGLGAARNVGLAAAVNELVLMTDDDCEVPQGWLMTMAQPFLELARVGMVFCNVVAGPFDPDKGYVPVSVALRPVLITRLLSWRTTDGVNVGIGAGMAVRRAVAVSLGGFDEAMGSGGRFRSGEELDFALRALANGHHVYRTAETQVIHHGFRTFQQGRRHIRDGMFSVGVVYGKLLKCGHWDALPLYLSVIYRMILFPLLASLMCFKKPPVLGRMQQLALGFVAGLRNPVHRGQMLFREV
jgi:glycosyltransferase involved in cell wall biosynthesis